VNNSKGSTLAIAVSMVFLFSALGIGAIEYAGGQGLSTNFQTVNTQAFWLADAGMQQSLANSGAASPNYPSPTSFGNGTYLVTSSTSGNTTTVTSVGTVTGMTPVITKTLKAVGTITSVFQNALLSGMGSTTLDKSDTFTNYNSSGAAVTPGNVQIATDASTITKTSTGGPPGLPSNVTSRTSAGIVLTQITVPSALLSAQCPTGSGSATGPASGSWNVTTSTTFTGSGNYQCSYLSIASGATLTINTNVVLYLTATDPATGPDGTADGEDLRCSSTDTGATCSSTTLGYVKILSGGSLTIYANGRMTFGSNSPYTLNVSSNVDFLNQDPWDPAVTYPTTGTTYVTYNDQAWASTNTASNINKTPSAGSVYWTLNTYSAGTTYAANDYVTYTTGTTTGAWRSTVANNLGNIPGSSTCAGSPAPSSACWVLSNNPIPANINIYSLYVSPVGWNSTTNYALNDLVTYAGGAWESTGNNNLNNAPSSSSSSWSSIVWNSATSSYPNNTFVTYPNGSQIWQSVIPVTNNNILTVPLINHNSSATTYWEAYAGIEIGNNGNHFFGVVYAPQSLAIVNNGETVSGAVAGNTVDIQPLATINYDQSLSTNNTSTQTTFNLTNWTECPPSGC